VLVGAGAVVDVGVSVGGTGEEVEMKVDVSMGGANVALGSGVVEGVCVGKLGMMVTPGTGVRVGMFGTHSNCPA
jgi:hypothetical protein